jgi:hypothetical protein
MDADALLAFELRYRLTQKELVARRGFTLKAQRVGPGGCSPLGCRAGGSSACGSLSEA